MANLPPLKLSEITRISAIQSPPVTVPACIECVAVFKMNAEAVVAVAKAPAFSAIASVHWLTSCTTAMVAQGFGNAVEIMNLKAPEFHGFLRLAEDHMRDAVQKLSVEEEDNLRNAFNNLEQIVMHSGPGVHEIFERHLKSIVVQAWSAVEVLIEDLHTVAIERHPTAFTPAVVTKHTLGKTTHKGAYQFRSPRTYRESYDDAFDQSPAILATLDSVSMLSLLQLRNAISHKGGRADRKFMTIDLPALPPLAIFSPVLDQFIQFDGEKSLNIIEPAFHEAYNLIQQVDSWLLSKGITP